MANIDTNRPSFFDACFAAKVRMIETGIRHEPMYVARKGWSAVPMLPAMIAADIGV